MNIQHHEKGFHYNDREMLHIAKKVGKMATYCKRVKDEASYISVDAELRQTEKKRDALKVAITVNLPQKQLRAESRRPDVTEAIDRCVDKLQPQLERYKDLHVNKGRAQKAQRRARKSQ